MSRSILEVFEKQEQDNNRRYLEYLMAYYSSRIMVFQRIQNRNSKVYGDASGSVSREPLEEIEGIVLSDDMVPVSTFSAGTFEGGVILTRNEQPNLVGNDIQIIRDDSKERFFHVHSREAHGFTTETFVKYRIASTEPHEGS